MSKRLSVLLLVVLLVFSACSNQTVSNDVTQDSSSAGETTTAMAATTTVASSQTTETTTETDQLDSANVAAKLSYDQAINKEMYTGFSDIQLKMLNDNGFVVLKPEQKFPYLFMHQLYEHADYGDQSVFITTDVVLNMFHVYYSGSLKALETAYYYNDMVALTNGLIGQIDIEYKQADEQLKPYYQRLYAYAVLAGKFLHDEPVEFSEISEYDEASQKAIKDKFNNNSAAWGELIAAVPAEVMQLVDADYQSIMGTDATVSIQNPGLIESQILGKRLDATQFIVRGHYMQSKLLSNFFKGMMWYSLSGFDISMEDRDNLVLTQLLAQIFNQNEALAELWNNVYSLTAFYSGASDDLNHKDISALTAAVYGGDFDALKLLDSSYDAQLEAAIADLPEPLIKPVVNGDYKFADLDYTHQYRLMGQRFSFDSYAMTRLTKSPERLNISAFDVFAAMGNQQAEALLYEYYEPDLKWPEYPARLDEVKAEYNDYKKKPLKDLYMGWLRAIDLALNEVFDGKIPYFMSTEAYAYKRVNTALGSFAELKHDNVLYSKQMMAEMGGGDDERGRPLHYVEPNVELYQTLLDVVRMAQQNSSSYQDDAINKPLDRMAECLELLIKVSQKELTGDTITQQELIEIGTLGGIVDGLLVQYNAYITNLLGGEYEVEKTSALITDIATILELGYLEVGIGIPHQIYALVEINGQPVITKGVVYSAVSFYNNERLTDEKWREMLGLADDEYGYYEYTPEKNQIDLTELMPYTKQFVAPDQNNVEYQYIEMHWPKE